MRTRNYKPRRPRLGLRDWLKRHTAVTSDSVLFGELFFKAIVMAAPFTRVKPLDALIQRVALMTPKHHTAGYSIPLNLDLADKVHPVVLPVELMKKTVAEATYRAIFNECMCRHTFECHDYPHDLGCLFLGDGARVSVQNGVAHEATVEECCEHIDRAAELGLAGHAFWVEIEEFVWGVPDANMQNYLEICFCCPCCCAAFRYEQKAYGHTKTILHKSAGWVCEVGEGCAKCGACVSACPRNLITMGDDAAVIAEECSGCGLCAPACPNGVLQLQQKAEMKENLTEYFEGLGLKI
ncbi:MAG: DUF362 domain-containing protein [Coriobacteriia bacterium]